MEGDRLSQANILARKISDGRGAATAVLSALPEASSRPAGAAPRVLRGEGYAIESWVFERERSIHLTASDRTIHLIVPVEGSVSAIPEGLFGAVRPGQAILLAGRQTATLTWAAGAAGAIVSLPRHRLQAHASRLFGEPLRLAPVNSRLERLDEAGGLVDILQSLWRLSPARLGGAEHEAASQFTRRLALAVVEAVGRDRSSGALTPAHSVRRAIDHVRASAPAELGIACLAAAAGTTERTLRDNFRAVLGQSVQAFVQEARLQWAHDRLGSAQDNRSIEAFATAAGFRNSRSFARAYQGKFGQTPSLTRARAVRATGRL